MTGNGQKNAAVNPLGRVLIVAGSDCSGGAGIQADIKTITMLGQYAASAITAVTVQNTLGVTDVTGLSSSLIKAQIKAVLDDIGADAVKTGMLHSVDVIEAFLQALAESNYAAPIIVDPVMVATSGDRLINENAVEIMRECLLPKATVITPNIPEAEILADMQIYTLNDMIKAGEKLLNYGPRAVVVKAGHLNADILTDILITNGAVFELKAKKLDTKQTHGTGCTFASAMAALIAKGSSLEEAFKGAHAFVQEAINHAPGFGAGHGPLGHASVRGALQW